MLHGGLGTEEGDIHCLHSCPVLLHYFSLRIIIIQHVGYNLRHLTIQLSYMLQVKSTAHAWSYSAEYHMSFKACQVILEYRHTQRDKIQLTNHNKSKILLSLVSSPLFFSIK